jgi:hypothetical protein
MPDNFPILLILAYSITFGLQNDKVKTLTDWLRKLDVFERMLSCGYCTGFHAGWVSWSLLAVLQGFPAEGWYNALSLILTALTAAIAVYFADMLLQAIERHAQR